jgi:hypothetical protein
VVQRTSGHFVGARNKAITSLNHRALGCKVGGHRNMKESPSNLELIKKKLDYISVFISIFHIINLNVSGDMLKRLRTQK